ncbi:EamA family transporter [soil metagenome]|jgi:drug/metabolite transporter (DMT)-like permease
MTLFALGLILAAAVVHASWNLLAKRVGGGAGFVWLIAALASALYAPPVLVLVVVQRPALGPLELLFIAGTALLHLAYFVSLQRGYRFGDLSLVYPLARGTGPLLATVGAILLFAERPTPLALFGTGLIVLSVFVLAGGVRVLRNTTPDARQALSYGLLTGLFIAAYTLWDKHAVSALLIPPLLYDWAANLGRALLLTPLAWRRRGEVGALWRRHRLEVIGVAALSPLSYLLVLTAMVATPVSYVAPAREVSILIGAALGARFLAEGDVRRRLLAASGMVVGVIALALG